MTFLWISAVKGFGKLKFVFVNEIILEGLWMNWIIKKLGKAHWKVTKKSKKVTIFLSSISSRKILRGNLNEAISANEILVLLWYTEKGDSSGNAVFTETFI